MSLDGLLLEKIARWRPDGRQTLEVRAPELTWFSTVTADAVDVVGCRLWEVSLGRSREAMPLGDLNERAATVARRVSGLMEPLRLIEVDSARAVALLRSDSPTRRGDVASYYEILLHADGAAVVRRYEAPHGEETRRHQVVYTLTHESLAKLVSDLTD
jgi:hypothetical protein